MSGFLLNIDQQPQNPNTSSKNTHTRLEEFRELSCSFPGTLDSSFLPILSPNHGFCSAKRKKKPQVEQDTYTKKEQKDNFATAVNRTGRLLDFGISEIFGLDFAYHRPAPLITSSEVWKGAIFAIISFAVCYNRGKFTYPNHWTTEASDLLKET